MEKYTRITLRTGVDVYGTLEFNDLNAKTRKQGVFMRIFEYNCDYSLLKFYKKEEILEIAECTVIYKG